MVRYVSRKGSQPSLATGSPRPRPTSVSADFADIRTMTCGLPRRRKAVRGSPSAPRSPNLSTPCRKYRGEMFNSIKTVRLANFESRLVTQVARLNLLSLLYCFPRGARIDDTEREATRSRLRGVRFAALVG
jgi:hypothetical protein